jgi:UDP-N-acetylmuramoylalanine-D-glutamate ligase
MFVESFHNQLKTISFSGKRNRRLDVLLDTLLRIENDHCIRYLTMTSYNNPTDEDVRLQDRHNRGLEIDNARVKQISNTAFSWESST